MNCYKIYLDVSTNPWSTLLPTKIVDITNREVIDLSDFVEAVQEYIIEKMGNESIYQCSFYFNGSPSGIDMSIDYDPNEVTDEDVDKINDILFYDYKIKCVLGD